MMNEWQVLSKAIASPMTELALYRRSVCPRCDWFRDELINA